MKQIIIILSLTLCAVAVSGQIAIRGGVNYSDVTIEGTNVMTDSKVGFHAGLQGHLGIGTILAVRPALLYNIKGAKVEASGASQSNSLHYLEAPINLAMRFGISDIGIILEGGPYLGYLVNTGEGIFEDINKTDWGVNFGGVVELSDIGFGVNYSNSLGDVEKQDQLPQAFKLTNGNLAAFIYFKF